MFQEFAMAKRFLDTGFYKSPFVRSLQAPYKALYQFIICDSSAAGIWVVDFEAAKLYTGFPVDRSIAEGKFLTSGKAVDLGDGRWFIPGFIRHQYPKGLQAENPAHRNVIAELKSYSLITNDLELSIQDPSKELQRPFKGSKDKVMVMEEVMDKVKEGGVGETKPEIQIVEFENFRLAYGGQKNGYGVELKNFQRHKDWQQCLPLLMPALEIEIAWREAVATTKKFLPEWAHLRTWINQRRWEKTLPQIEKHELTRDQKFELARQSARRSGTNGTHPERTTKVG